MQLYLGSCGTKQGHWGDQTCGPGISLTCALGVYHEAHLVPVATFQGQIILYKGLLVHEYAHLHSYPVSVANAEDWQVSWQEYWLDPELKSLKWAASP